MKDSLPKDHEKVPLPAGRSRDLIYGLIPVLEALRAGKRTIDNITITEGSRHERLRELLVLAKKAGVVMKPTRGVISTSSVAWRSDGRS